MSLRDRILLIATAFLGISPLYFLRDLWWLIPVLVILSGFFFWKGVTGTYLSILEDSFPSEACSIEQKIADSDLAGKLTEIAATREASFLAINIFASSAKTVGGIRCLSAAWWPEPLESCPQRSALRMGL